MNKRFYESGGWWVVGQFFFVVTLPILGLLFKREWVSRPGALAGAFLLVSGGLIALLGFLTLGRNLTPFPKPRPGAFLVQSGIYRFIRHPLYTSLMVTGLGWALIRQSIPALVGALLFAVFLNAKAGREERWLCSRFPEYASYQQRVRRFVPWLW